MPICPQITNTPITVTYNSTDYILDSVQDVQTTATTFYAAPTPTAQAVGDTWFDTSNGNKLYRWDGSSWVSVQDAAIASAASAASTANSNASAALTSANGKNKVFYGSSTPTATSVGDLWFDGSNTNRPNQWNGSSWVPFGLGYLAVTSIDAGNITTGTLTSRTIDNGSGTFHVDTSGNVSASSLTVTGGYIAGGSGTGFQIGSGYLLYGNTYLNASGGTGAGAYCLYDSSRGIYLGGTMKATAIDLGSYGWTSSGTITAGIVNSTNVVTATITGNTAINLIGQTTVTGNLQVTAMSSTSATGVVWSSSNNRFYLTTSTERHKDNITPIPMADYLSKLLELDVVTFNYKPEFTDNPNQLISGLIAERVAAIPEFSTTINFDKDGLPESIAYDRLAMFILPALKQINDRLIKLEGK
jgi:hypothetical protein